MNGAMGALSVYIRAVVGSNPASPIHMRVGKRMDDIDQISAKITDLINRSLSSEHVGRLPTKDELEEMNAQMADIIEEKVAEALSNSEWSGDGDIFTTTLSDIIADKMARDALKTILSEFVQTRLDTLQK